MPEVLCFCCYIWNISPVLSLSEQLKRRFPACRIFFGGPEAGYSGERLLTEHSFLDGILEGEGEKTLPALLDCLEGGENICGIPGITVQEGYSILRKEPGEPPALPPGIRENELPLSDGRIAVVLYRDRNPVTGEYPVEIDAVS